MVHVSKIGVVSVIVFLKVMLVGYIVYVYFGSLSRNKLDLFSGI